MIDKRNASIGTVFVIILFISCSGSNSSQERPTPSTSSDIYSECNSEYINTSEIQSLGQPFCFGANSVGSDFVNLRWFDTADDETEYVVERSIDNSNFDIAGSIPSGSGTRTFYDSGLTPGTDYYYRVRASNGAGDYSAYANATITTDPEWTAPDYDIDNDQQDNFIKTSASKIVVNDRTFVDYFESGFFNGVMDFTERHGKTLDFRLSGTSEGINFGANLDLSGQIPANSWLHSHVTPLTDSMGDIDANGFIQKNGASRDATHHSAGCYE